MADPARSPGDPAPVAGFVTLSRAGFGKPPRHGFERRLEAAADAAQTVLDAARG